MTSATCPQCGTPVQSGSTICTACGHELSEVVVPAPPAETLGAVSPAATDSPPADPALRTTLPKTDALKVAPSFDVSRLLNDTRERWGVGQSPTFIVAILLAALAFTVGTLAVVSYLSAGLDELDQKFDADVWFRLATGSAIGAAALMVLERWRSPAPATDTQNLDLRVGLAVCGLVLAFVLLGLFKGLDESQDAEYGWMSYARIFTLLVIAWFAISRPIPLEVAGLPSVVIGMGAVAIGLILLLTGTLQARRDDYSTYVSGITLQDAGGVLMLMAFGWFLGLQPRSAAS